MKILIVCSGNVENFNFIIHKAFVYEQAEALKKYHGIEYDVFLVRGKGIFGYLKNFPSLIKKIKNYSPDLIHAHFGLSALLANLQRRIPVITTLHGSDLNLRQNRKYSLTARFLSKATIIVSKEMMNSLKKRDNDYVVPCGIDLDIFFPMDKEICRKKLKWKLDKSYILFSSRFENPVKNFRLAKEALAFLQDENIEIIELKNKSREEVNLMLNAADILLLTSISEGSPQIIKEAMACNCPIVATDVGDIHELIGTIDGCYITTFDPRDVADKIKKAIEFSKTRGRTNGREKIKHLDNKIIAEKIFSIYQKVLSPQES